MCPQCGGKLVRPTHSPVWCRECEWNLEAFPPPRRRKATVVDRVSHRIAFRLNRALLDDLTQAPPARPTWNRVRIFLVAASLLLTAASLSMIVGGVLLLFGHQFGLRVVGFFMLLIGLEIRPRLGRWRVEVGVLSRTEAPHLFALVDEIADELGAPRIGTLAVHEHWNASCGRRGLRREPTLVIGLPLWSALSPAGRTALLGHELGHLVNRDATRGLVTQSALTTFARIAALFFPRYLVRTRFARLGLASWLGGYVVGIVFTPIYYLATWTQVGLWSIASRDHQRAEIYADVVGLKLAGTAGAMELLDTLLFHETVRTAVARSARRGDPVDAWHENAVTARAEALGRARVAEQSSLRREASLFGSHPPSGLRRRLVSSWPSATAGPLVASDHWLPIDDELSERYKRVRRALSNM